MNQLTNHTLLPDTDYIPDNTAIYMPDPAAKPATEGVDAAEGGEFDVELTAGAVYDALQERLALARTRALMGERTPALDLLRQARADYETYRDALQGFPLHALEHAFTVTMQTLCAEKRIAAEEIEANTWIEKEWIEREKVEREKIESAEEMPLALTASKALSEPAERGVVNKARSRKRASKAA